MRHQGVEAWEASLATLLRTVDTTLETEFRGVLPRHPMRPAEGHTANPQMDGLFRVTATFSAGFGSSLGRGYVLQIDCITLETLSAELRETIETRAVALIQEGLPSIFPGRALRVAQDGNIWKIVGDLSW